jgi:O-methyltransferase involved in polyketide biosynthesis
MTTSIEQLRTYIDEWQSSFVDDRNNKRGNLIEQIFQLAEAHKNSDIYAELEPWLKAFQISLKEQAKYETWRNKFNDVYDFPEKKAELNAERVAVIKKLIILDNHQKRSIFSYRLIT